MIISPRRAVITQYDTQIDVKVHPQDRQEMPQNKQEWRINGSRTVALQKGGTRRRWGAIALFIDPSSGSLAMIIVATTVGADRHKCKAGKNTRDII